MNAARAIVPDAAEGLASEARAFDGTGPQVRLWTAKVPALVCPAAFRRKAGFDVAARHTAARGWPLHLRPTGGGAVPQGRGVLNLALAFTAGRDFGIEAGYRLIAGIIRDALGPVGPSLAIGATPDSFCDGTWNLSISGRKLVGTAQRIRPAGEGRRRVLVHALILVDGDLSAGVGAVNRLHADLGLPPVACRAHTSLADVMGPEMPDPARFSRILAARATEALAPTPAAIAA